MRTRSAFLGITALAALALAAPQEVLLRRIFQPNTQDVYSIDMDTKTVVTTPMGEQDMDVKGTMTMAIAVGEVKNGKADIEIKTTDIKFEYGGIAAMAQSSMAPMPKEIVVKAKMDDRNRMSESKLEGVDAQMAMMMNAGMQMAGQTIEFPEKAIKVGGTWTVVMPKSEAMGTNNTNLTAKLVEERADGYAVLMTGTVPMSMDLAALAKKNPKLVEGLPTTNAKVTGTMDLKMEGLIEKGSGKTLRMTSRIKMKQNTSLPDMGLNIESNGETVIKMSPK